MNLPVPRTVAVNGVMVDFAGGFVRDRDGREIPLRPQAFDLLKYLLQNAGRLVTKDELMKAVWPGVFVTDDSLVQCVRDVRRAIGDEDQSVLKAVPKRGYRFTIPAAVPPSARTRWRMGAVAASVLVLIAVGLVWRFARPPAELRSFDGPPVVAVVPFINVGGDEAAQKLALEMKARLTGFADQPRAASRVPDRPSRLGLCLWGESGRDGRCRFRAGRFDQP